MILNSAVTDRRDVDFFLFVCRRNASLFRFAGERGLLAGKNRRKEPLGRGAFLGVSRGKV